MPTLIIKGKITKGYDHWLAAFDGSDGTLSLNTVSKCHIPWSGFKRARYIRVMHTPTMEAVQKHMENDAELISEAG